MRAIRVPSPAPRSGSMQIRSVLASGSHVAIWFIGAVVAVTCIKIAQVMLAPIFLAVVIGLMFGPVADRIERFRIPPAASAAAVVLAFLLLIAAALAGMTLPLLEWLDRLPDIWERLQIEVARWQGLFTLFENMQEAVRSLLGQQNQIVVSLEEGSTMGSAAFLAPVILAQMLVFLVSMYFFIATRHQIRLMVLSLSPERRLRWHIAHVFRDIESSVSRYLLSITAINIGLGVSVALGLWAAGVPSPFLWGTIAALLNYIVYIGPAIMAVLLLGVGLGTGESLGQVLMPSAIFLLLNFIEAQFVSPLVIGRSMTLNPFLVFLTLTFWIWLWGPTGGFVAVPSVLVLAAIIRNITPLGQAR